jgi:hypothetical protein
MQEVRHRGAFAQKLGIGSHIEIRARCAVALHHAPDPLIRVHRHRALLNDHFISADAARNLRCDCIHVRQVGIAGVRLRRAHRNEDRLSVPRGLSQIRGELQPLVAMTCQQLGQKVLMDRHAAFAQQGHFLFIVVHTDNRMPDLRKTHRRHKSDIA